MTAPRGFRAIPGVEHYEVNADGQVRSLTRVDSHGRRRPGRVLTPYLTGKLPRYPTVQIGEKNMKVHRLVALAFLPSDPDRSLVNHKNGNTHDNRVENLEWCTYSENMRHAVDVLGHLSSAPKAVIGENLTSGRRERWRSVYQAAHALGLRRGSISRAASGHYRQTGGWRFEWEA